MIKELELLEKLNLKYDLQDKTIYLTSEDLDSPVMTKDDLQILINDFGFRAQPIFELPEPIYIKTPERDEYDELISLWESSVRETHFFLNEEDFEYFENENLRLHLEGSTELKAAYISQEIVGFIACSEESIELLFILPAFMNQGLGEALCREVLMNSKIRYVEVNQENKKALDFYNRLGFHPFKTRVVKQHRREFTTVLLSRHSPF